MMKLSWSSLVVDDNPADVALVREALAGSKLRCQISSVGDGVEALAFLDHREKYVHRSSPTWSSST